MTEKVSIPSRAQDHPENGRVKVEKYAYENLGI